MQKKNKSLDQFADLTWNDLEKWVGSRIVGRGRSYWQQGRVSELAATSDGSLIAWVEGSKRYVTKVDMDEDGLPDSVCTCPYELDCKHGVAVVLEYLARVKDNRQIPKTNKDDARLELFEDGDWNDEVDDDENALPGDMQKEIDAFLKSKTKAQIIELVRELAEQHPDIGQDLTDRQQLTSGNTKALVTRLRKDILEIGEEPGWQNYWRGEGYTPDYSEIRNKLETLLQAGHADEVLALGEELLTIGTRQVEESHDEGETATEIADCMPVLVKALEQSSLESADKLVWAVNAVLKDEFDLCEPVAQYLMGYHKKSDWSLLTDVLFERLKKLKFPGETFSRNYARDQLSNWVIHALECAGRKEEIIPLCEAEARKTGSYDRLVKELISAKRYEDAERWIQEGIRATEEKWPGIASSLRDKLREIRTCQKNWPTVAAMQSEEFVRHPSGKTFTDCKKAANKAKAWIKVRAHLLDYLEKGMLPWKQKDWPLPETGLDVPDTTRRQFPIVDELINIAILEKKPDQVLHWYDRLPKKRFGWYGIDEDKIATAVQTHAPDRAVAIWKNKAERLISQVKPSAYQEAAKYLRKAAKVMNQVKKQAEWERYLKGLREKHIRKRRLMEILDGLDDKPIVKKKRK